jgi:hypothetical protein
VTTQDGLVRDVFEVCGKQGPTRHMDACLEMSAWTDAFPSQPYRWPDDITFEPHGFPSMVHDPMHGNSNGNPISHIQDVESHVPRPDTYHIV